MNNKYDELFAILSNNLATFINTVKRKKSTLMATEQWSVKDELCHIVFWHEMYASNYQAQADNVAPILPDEMSTINDRGVKSLRKYSIKTLLKRLLDADKSLYINIVEKKIPSMKYSVKGRVYTTEDFLIMISRHLNTHTVQVRRAK